MCVSTGSQRRSSKNKLFSRVDGIINLIDKGNARHGVSIDFTKPPESLLRHGQSGEMWVGRQYLHIQWVYVCRSHCFKTGWLNGFISKLESPQAKSKPSLVNEVSLEHSPACLLTYGAWLLSCSRGRVEQRLWRSVGPQSLKHLFPCALQKNVLTFGWDGTQVLSLAAR